MGVTAVGKIGVVWVPSPEPPEYAAGSWLVRWIALLTGYKSFTGRPAASMGGSGIRVLVEVTLSSHLNQSFKVIFC